MSVSRRGAVKVNPVTGEMVKLTAEEVAARRAGHTDGALRVDDKYINAAKDLGLGGAEGMYQHIGALKRVGAADVPVGDSIEREGRKPTNAPSGRAAASSSTGRAPGVIDVTKSEAVAATLKTTVASTGKGGKIAGFSSGRTGTAAIHRHADAFQRQKGVVNTIGGVTDVRRREAEEKPGERAGPRVVSMDTIDTLSKEGRARIEARERRERLERAHSSSAAPRAGGVHTFSGRAAVGGKDGSAGYIATAPTKRPLGPSRVVSGATPTGMARAAAPTASSAAASVHAKDDSAVMPSGPRRLGGPSSKENDAAAIAAQRAAFFKQRLAEEEARKADARAAAAVDV